MATNGDPARATSFGSIALDYDRYRPGPPDEAVRWLLGGHRGVAVEIGAGTGALTRALVGEVDRVVAVEPDLRMGQVLAANLPGVPVMVGRAEALALTDRSADALVGSSMWHWVDQTRAVPEAARVLRPGGVLGLLWSGPDRSQGWLAELLAGPGLDQAALAALAARRAHRHEVVLPPDAPFGAPETRTVRWQLTVTTDQLVGLAGTYSRVLVLPEPERTRFRDDVADFIAGHPAIAGRDEIDLPMRCHCWRAVRTG
jgi:SAM-dependent methyltransferase